MQEGKILSGLSYLSIIFAPILFPLIVWIASSNREVKYNAIRALKLHLIPVILTIFMLFLVTITGLLTNNPQSLGVMGILLLIVAFVVDFALVIYNIVIGIKLLAS